MIIFFSYKSIFYTSFESQLERVNSMVADPFYVNPTTDTDTHIISDIGHIMVNHIFGCLDKFRKRSTDLPNE